MQLLVMNATTRCSVVIPASATVYELKQKVERTTRVPADSMDLRLQGHSLSDALSLAMQGVENRDRLELVAGGSSPAGSADSRGGPATAAAKEVAVRQQQQLEAAFSEVDRLTARADALETLVRTGAPDPAAVHQEHFTRVLESLDCLQLDGLTEAQRDVIRPVRKALVKRTEEIANQALQAGRRRSPL